MDDAEFGSVLLPLSAGAGAGDDDAAAEENAASTRRRTCDAGCGRPASVCVCAHLPVSPIPTAATVVVLHHPHELRRNRLATLPLLSRSLLRLVPVPGRRLRPGSSPLLDSRPSPTLFLFPGPRAIDLARWAAATPPRDRASPVLVVFDGTWAQAREMAAASLPFLEGFATWVTLGGGFDEGTGEEGASAWDSELVLKKEPHKGCVSTAEAVARALRVLEPEGQGAKVEAALLKALRAMAGFQASYMKPMKPRPRLTKKTKEKETEMSKRDEEEPGD